jgi:hypothetical protein
MMSTIVLRSGTARLRDRCACGLVIARGVGAGARILGALSAASLVFASAAELARAGSWSSETGEVDASSARCALFRRRETQLV